MSRPILLVVVPPGVGPVLAAALAPHAALVARDGVRIQRLHSALDVHTRARVHSDKMPWDIDADWVDRLVDATLRGLSKDGAGRRTVWRAHTPAAASRVSEALGAIPLVWAADPRHALRGGADDPVAAAARVGRAWAEAVAAARSLPRAIDATDRPSQVLAGLGLSDCASTRTALGLLHALPPPVVPLPLVGALAAHPATRDALRDVGVAVPAVPEHPVALLIRAQTTDRPDDRIGLARRVLAARPGPDARAAALDLLIEHGATDHARALLVRWMREADAELAWEGLLTDRTGTPEAGWVQAARRHASPRVRGALARWLVARGLDRQAAETVCRVRDTDWFHDGRR